VHALSYILLQCEVWSNVEMLASLLQV